MMKDKLYKNNHKRMYYVMRKTLLSLAVFVGVATAVAIPTTLNVLRTEPTTLKAAEVEEKVEKEKVEESLEEYNDSTEDPQS